MRDRSAQPSFQSILTARLLVITFLAVLAIAFFGAQFLTRQMQEDAEEHLLESAMRVRDGLESYLNLHKAAISTLADGVSLPQDEKRAKEIAGAALEQLGRNYPGFLTLLMTNAEGKIVRAERRGQASFTPGIGESQWVSDREYFLKPKSNGKPFVSGVFQGRGLGKDPIVAMSAPILGARKEFLGVVEGSIDIRQIPLQAGGFHRSMHVVVFDADGRIVYSTRPGIYKPLQQWKPNSLKQPGQTKFVEGKLYRLRDPEQKNSDGTVMMQYAVQIPVHSVGWQAVALTPVSELQAEANRFYRDTLVVLLLLGFVAWMLARRMSRTIADPLVSLVAQMQSYDVSDEATAPKNRSFVAKEIEQLQTEFRMMGRRLRDSFASLRTALEERDTKNTELQEVLRNLDQKVRERTAQLAYSEARYRTVIEESSDIIFRTDPWGRILFHNVALEKMLGCRAEGQRASSFLAREHRAEFLQRLKAQDWSGSEPVYLEYCVIRKDGEARWLGQSTHALYDDVGALVGFQANARDITDQKRAEQAMQEAQQRYALAVKGSNNGIWDWDLRTGEVYFSERWRQMFGIAAGVPLQSIDDWLERVHWADQTAVKAELKNYSQEPKTDLFESEHRIRHEDGSWCWVKICGAAVRGANGHALRIAGSATDVTEGKLIDPLTGLPNRLAAVDRLEQLVARQNEDPTRCFAALFLDLDRFKLVNDSLGHIMGDHLLLGVSWRLQAAIESSGMQNVLLSRLGGDEFVVVVELAGQPGSAEMLAELILKEMEDPFHLNGSPMFVSLSIGVAKSETGPRGADDLLRNADTAMYQAKTMGKGRYCVFDASMQEQALARLELETDLRKAVENEEFVLHYQPQVNLKTGRLAGFEALVRWNHPTRGMVPPLLFISVAEENGLILPIGRWVLEQGVRQLALWDQVCERGRDLAMSINLSAMQFADPELRQNIIELLKETGISSKRLHLEITESMVADDPKIAKSILAALADMGVGLEIDDFGTGYSSLSQLHQLPFDTLKVDRSFVQMMDQPKQDGQGGRKIVDSIVSLSGSLGIEVIAEGIETEEHWTRLAGLGCQLGQGYFFSRPVPAELALQMIETRTLDPWPLPQALREPSQQLIRLHVELEASGAAGDGSTTALESESR
jgi:diguanylate cyclase (GGDEF)-like protein/PAS domain S-box-containing protein